MSHQALYRQYRPKTFDDVVEQQHVVTTLKNTVVSGKPAHAYLFCGTRGTGKTTMAKVFARAVNCLNPQNGNPCNQCEICGGILDGTLLDVTEMDAASNNSVDNVRDIIDEVVYAPTRAAYKVYIIDEVHMLSSGAFNALLKTLEEPPEHVLFVLATTEPHKLPATVLSRCQRFDFRRISMDGIAERLLLISREVDIHLAEDSARFIASVAEGALRDAISLLDQCIATGKNVLELASVYEILGIAPRELVLEAGRCLMDRDGKEAVHQIEQLFTSGKDPGQFLQSLIRLFRDILVFQSTNSMESLLSTTEKEGEKIPEYSRNISMAETLAIVRELTGLESGMKWSTTPRIMMEMSFLKICSRELNKDTDTLLERIRLLEERLRYLEGSLPQSHGQKINENQKMKKEDQREKVRIPIRGKESVSNNKGKESKQEPTQNKPNNREPISEGEKVFVEWDRVLEELKKTGHMKLYSSLIGTNAVWMGEEVLGILMSGEDVFIKKVITKSENMEWIIEAIERCIGRCPQIRIISDHEKGEETAMDIPDTVVAFAEKNGLHLDIVEE